jgi:hypothetical protein
MRFRLPLLPASLAAALAFSACNSARAPAPAPAEAPPPSAAVKLPEGAGCTAQIARFRAIQDNDLKMGHVNKTVYGQIAGEIAEAESACAAGEDARAQSLIRASRSRHGYPG